MSHKFGTDKFTVDRLNHPSGRVGHLLFISEADYMCGNVIFLIKELGFFFIRFSSYIDVIFISRLQSKLSIGLKL